MDVAILFYTDTFWSTQSGPQNIWGRSVYNMEFAKALLRFKQNHNAHLIVPTGRDAVNLQNEWLNPLGINDVAIIPFVNLKDHLNKNPIDVMHVLDPNLHRAAHIRQHLSPKHFTITGVTHSLGHDHFLNWAVQSALNGILCEDALICTTKTAQDVVKSFFNRIQENLPDLTLPSTPIIPLGIDLNNLQPTPTQSRSDFGCTDDQVVLLSLARFHHQFKMDLAPLITVFEQVIKSTKQPVKLLLAGSANSDTHSVQYLKQIVAQKGLSEHISFITNINDNQKHALYSLADVFVSFSDNIQETFGISIIEALGHGIPVVASDWDGYKSLITPQKTGFLIPTTTLAGHDDLETTLPFQRDAIAHLFLGQSVAIDIEQAVTALKTVIESAELRNTLGQNARESAAEYDWKEIINQHFSLWEQLCKKSPAQPPAKSSTAIQFYQDFSGYASQTLKDSDCFEVTPKGRDALSGKENITLYPHMQDVLKFEVMAHLLKAFAAGQTLPEIKKHPHLKATTVDYHTVWLYKYGFLKRV